ncbi:MAG: hypothetical protein Q8P00_02595 [Dehalococcoidia bacterium]|nr:hypothetical protein [Dehalococcoidia bacterium]
MNIAVLPLVSSIVSLAFAITVLDQYFARRKPHQLVWAIGLFMYFLSTGAEFWTGAWGLGETVYRLWYLVGAVFVAAYLGMGTLYLLARRRVANIIMAVLLVASAYAVFKVFSASIDLGGLQGLSGKAMPRGVRLMTPFFNSFGTLALVGGALYSAWAFWRKKIMPHRVASNILIAVGAILPAFGGTVMRFWNSLTAFYILELLGVVIIYIGFLRSREVFGFPRFPLVHGFGRVPEKP